MKDFKDQEITETNTKAVRPTSIENSYTNNVEYSRYLVGYYTDEACTQAFNFDTVLTQSTVIYVKWDNKVLITVSKASGLHSDSYVKLNGTKITQTSFYAIKGQTIEAQAKKGFSLYEVTVTVSESYGGKSASNSGSFLGAKATISFTVEEATLITMS